MQKERLDKNVHLKPVAKSGLGRKAVLGSGSVGFVLSVDRI